MIQVGTGVDNGDPGTSAGVAVCISGGAADLLGGGGHLGIQFAHGSHIRLIAGLNYNVRNACYRLDLIDLAVLHVGGNDVGGQCEVPHHIQLFTAEDFLRNRGSHGVLLTLQIAAVADCSLIRRNASGGEALNCRLVL